ncbi:MAG: hypothetical protein IPO13_00635 [Rhodocyclaceae bacterium]|nr:hypothetical protein [Rhodocyclaceae bacterium]
MGNGRTKPCLITCEGATPTAEDVQLVVKFSAGCMEREKNLAIEAIAAMLAADLTLPVPEPFLVDIDDDFISSISDAALKTHIQSSSRVAFGSRLVPNGFGVWAKNGRVPAELTQVAAEVFLFDAIIVNADRRPANPNCLTSGNEIAIFDHELSFSQAQELFWKEPWHQNGFDRISVADNHIFAPMFFEEKPVQLNRFKAAWEAIPVVRFKQYCNALPVEWAINNEFLEGIVGYLEQTQTNIGLIIERGLEKLK